MKWSTYIIVVFGSFMVFIITLVVKTYGVNTELVSDDYYNQELAYQHRIEELTHAKLSTNKIKIHQQADQLVVSFTDSLVKIEKGSIEFYRPSDASKDRTIALHTSDNGMQLISSKEFATGLYKVKFRWVEGDMQFYNEEDIYIQ